MNRIIQRANDAMSEAEALLRDLIAEAAQDGNYALVTTISRAAQQVVEARADLPTGITTNAEADVSSARKIVTGPRSGRTKNRGQHGRAAYPRFERRNGVLHKIGWSKKRRKEYVHKIQRAAFDDTVSAIEDLAKQKGGILSPEDIYSRASEINGDDVPQYQVYIVLAFLRNENLVDKVGREGYRVYTPADLQLSANLAWEGVKEAA